jgi:5-methyltetrahydropteroyltriglutamate--homocysteine methyltransferase
MRWAPVDCDPDGPTRSVVTAGAPATRPLPAPASIPPLAVMGIGSWPRPRWMLRAMHEHREGRLADAEFEVAADDAVRLAVGAQIRSGVDAVTDGEQRRDNSGSFLGGRLDNCQLIPLPTLRPLVDDPETFRSVLRPLDVPAAEVRHPAIVGPLGRSRPLAAHEHAFVRTLTRRPVKMTLPGPHLLTRLMWVEGIADRVYPSCEHLADDVIRVLREELHALLAAGVALVQLDEPLLCEAAFDGARRTRRTGGAPGAKRAAALELAFARRLLDRVLAELPRERMALHVCRGDFTPDERAAQAGDYRSLLPLLAEVRVGTLFLELSTPRPGELDLLRHLPDGVRIGVGVVDQKREAIEPVAEIAARARPAVQLFGEGRVLLTPDCGFATFADRPAATAGVAEAKLRAMVEAAELVRRG